MTPPDLTQRQRLDLEEGKRLLSEATPARWTRHEHWEGLDPTRKARNVYIDAPTARSDHVAFCGCVDRENPSAYVDATLIVWLRNNADALIAAAEREQEREEWKQRVLMPALTEWSEKLDAIAASLTPPEPQETP